MDLPILPADEIMKMMAKLALEQATQSLAAEARIFAKTLPSDMNGEMALTAFANAIESTNAKVWSTTGERA